MVSSRRAAILKEVLGYINSGDYDASGEFLIFGKEAFERHFGDSTEESHGFEDPLRELLTHAKVRRGKDSVQKRVSLKSPPKGFTEDELKAWKDFSSRFPIFEQFVEALASNAEILDPVEYPRNAESDDRDAALALMSLEWLERSVARLDGLEEVAGGVGLARNEEYFEEAHMCDLAGLKIATAVLCRAVLESALVQVVDPYRKIDRSKRPGYIELMLREAQRAGTLDAERVEAGLKVRNAGNDAIHNLPKFRKSFPGSMNEIVDNTRKVLADLYC